VNQNSAYEDATCDFIEHVLRGESFVSDLRWFADRLAQFGYINSLVQTTFKLTSPGVPDIYQGNELWDFSLVDPDNRRPVDFELRKQTLETVVGKVDQFKAAGYVPESAVSAALQHSSSGPVKLLVIAGLLAVRRRQPALLREGEYIPLNVEGPRASNLLAFARRSGQHWAVVVVPLKVAALLGKDESTEHFYEGDIRSLLASDAVWQNTTVELPQQLSGAKLHNIFGGSIHSLEQNKLSVAPLFKQLPTAVLIPKE
jgi:(1->4)-alpha-D-glucan 1-alpha-D-glucosylmutase